MRISTRGNLVCGRFPGSVRRDSFEVCRGCGAAGAHIREWKVLSRLQELNLKGCYKIEDAGLQGLSLLTSLTSLNMQECWQITQNGLAAISGQCCLKLAVPALYATLHW